MIAYPAIDVRDGRVVQLVGGQPDEERISLPDPCAVARSWIAHGFAALHVVDLDAALGLGDNARTIDRVVRAAGDTPVQVGGGVRTTERVASLIDAGAATVVVGTRAVRDLDGLRDVADRWSQRMVLAADIRGDEVLIRGWTEGAGISPFALLDRVAEIPLGGVLITDVSREGRMTGIDSQLFSSLVEASPHPLLASGGVASDDDLAALRAAGVDGVVLGMALYTGALDVGALAKEYGTW